MINSNRAHTFMSRFARHIGEEENEGGRISQFNRGKLYACHNKPAVQESEIMRQARMARPKITTTTRHWWETTA